MFADADAFFGFAQEWPFLRLPPRPNPFSPYHSANFQEVNALLDYVLDVKWGRRLNVENYESNHVVLLKVFFCERMYSIRGRRKGCRRLLLRHGHV